MASLNTATLLGNLGKDPVIKDAGGSKVCNFSIATSEKWKDKSGEMKEKTIWHNIVCWGRTAEVAAQYLKKGSSVLVTGKIDNRSWDKEDGTKGYISEIVVDRLVLMGKREDGGVSGTPGAPPPDDGSDLPF